MDAELGDDFGDVVLGGREGDVEAVGDLFVGEAFAEKGEDLPLARGEDVGVGRAAALAHRETSLRRIRRNYTGCGRTRSDHTEKPDRAVVNIL